MNNVEDRLRMTLQQVASQTQIPTRPALDPSAPVHLRPRPVHGRRRWAVLGAAAAAIAVGGTAGLVVAQSTSQPAAADVAFTAHPGYIQATVTHPYASKAALDKAFAAHHLDVTVQLVPASPSLVGTIVYTDNGSIVTDQQGSCITGGGGCPIGLRIPTDLTGPAHVAIGRAARAGEAYETTASSFAPGEALHCQASKIVDATIATARRTVDALGLKIVWHETVNGNGRNVAESDLPPASWVITDADPVSRGVVRLWARSAPLTARDRADEHRLSVGC